MKIAFPKLGMIVSGAALIAMALMPSVAGAAAPLAPSGETPVPPTPTPSKTTSSLKSNVIIAKSASPGTVQLNGHVMWTIDVTCTGDTECGNVYVNDTVPDTFQVVSAAASRSTSFGVNGNTIALYVNLMAQRETIRISIDSVAKKAGCITNVAQARADAPNDPLDDRATADACGVVPLPKTGGAELPVSNMLMLLAGAGLMAGGFINRRK